MSTHKDKIKDKANEQTYKINKQTYTSRRQSLLSQIKSGVAIIPTKNEQIRNQDTTYQYRFDSYFYYLTGFNEPESVLVLDGNNQKSILFCRDKNKEREIWDGFRYGPEGARESFGFDETHSINDFGAKILDLISDSKQLYYTIGHMPDYDQIIIAALAHLRNGYRRGVSAPHTIIDVNNLIAEQRLIKDASDIDLMRATCTISSLAHIEAMKYVRYATYEYEVEAKIMEVFYKHGARYPAYTPIVGGGKNACILHYVENNCKLNANDLLLVDAGSEYQGYAGDITRTYPVCGKFNKQQRVIYEIVLEANKSAIAKVKPGSLWNEPADIAVRTLVQGLIDIKLLKGSIEDNIANNSYKQFYMHGVGHWLGLDVHDVGAYKIDGKWRPFVAGMCTTIEPGLYIAPADNVPFEYWNIGVRIEDDILVTATGNENLTAMAPKEVVDLEALITSGSK